MRRRRPPEPELPEALARFVPMEWSDDLEVAIAGWQAARRAWMRDNLGQVVVVDYIAHTLAELRRVRGVGPVGRSPRRRPF